MREFLKIVKSLKVKIPHLLCHKPTENRQVDKSIPRADLLHE